MRGSVRNKIVRSNANYDACNRKRYGYDTTGGEQTYINNRKVESHRIGSFPICWKIHTSVIIVVLIITTSVSSSYVPYPKLRLSSIWGL